MKAAANIIAAVIIILGVCSPAATPVAAETITTVETEAAIPEQTDVPEPENTIAASEVIIYIMAAILGAIVALGLWLMLRS